MEWPEVIKDQTLRDLAYKIELDQWGQVVMTQASNRHGMIQAELVWIMFNQGLEGKVICECAIEVDNGVNVADVVWCSNEFIQTHGLADPYPKAPEICVEIVVSDYHQQQMAIKLDQYFRRGAKECWLVTESGGVKYYDVKGEQKRSMYDIDVHWHTINGFRIGQGVS